MREIRNSSKRLEFTLKEKKIKDTYLTQNMKSNKNLHLVREKDEKEKILSEKKMFMINHIFSMVDAIESRDCILCILY